MANLTPLGQSTTETRGRSDITSNNLPSTIIADPESSDAQVTAAREQAMSTREALSIGRTANDLIQPMVDYWDEHETLPAHGSVESSFINPDATQRGLFGDLLDSARSAYIGEENSNLSANRSQLIALRFKEAYESLKGAGQITEYEGKTAAAAINQIGTVGLEDSLMAEHYKVIQLAFSAANQRDALNISIDPTDHSQWRKSANGQPEQVFSYMDNAGLLKVIPTEGRQVVIISNNFTRDQQRNLWNETPAGEIIMFQFPDGHFQRRVKQ